MKGLQDYPGKATLSLTFRLDGKASQVNPPDNRMSGGKCLCESLVRPAIVLLLEQFHKPKCRQ